MEERNQSLRDTLGNSYDQMFGTDSTNMDSRIDIPYLEAKAEMTLVVKVENVGIEAYHISGGFKLWVGNYMVEDDIVHYFDLAM